MSERNLEQLVCDLDGNPFDVNLGTEEAPRVVPMTLRIACINALQAVMPGEESRSGIDKMNAHYLTVRIHKGGVQDLSVEDLALLKERTGRYFLSPAYMGPVWELLDPKKEEQP